MQKATLIILFLMASLCSGLAFSHEGLSAGSVLHYLASMYAPADPLKNDRVMTFGRELLVEDKSTTHIPQQTYLK